MSPIPDDFEQLRRLLALKRHEQPPPGYFHGFSRQIIVRIQAGELGDQSEASFWSFSGGSFIQRIWATLDARPVLAGAFGVAVCGFFVVGALLSDSAVARDPSPPPPGPVAQGLTPVWQEPNAGAQVAPSLVGMSVPNYQPRDAHGEFSADVVEPAARSLFKEIEARQAQTTQDRQVNLRLIPAHP
jgi:hypothetical protein